MKLKESRSATRSAQGELAEATRRYREKVAQWESSQEALDQLTDELEAGRNLLMESRQEASQLKGRMGILQERASALWQQVGANTR